MSVPIKSYLANRRNRMVGSIMGYLEANVIPGMNKANEDALRRVVRDSVNQYHDSVLDLVKAEEGVMRNEDVIALLERLATALPSRTHRPPVHQTRAPTEPMLPVSGQEVPHG